MTDTKTLLCCVGTCRCCDDVRERQQWAECQTRALGAREAWKVIDAKNGTCRRAHLRSWGVFALVFMSATLGALLGALLAHAFA